MKKASEIILGKNWPEVFKHPVVVKEYKKHHKRITPSEGVDFAYAVGVQNGWQEAFEFFMDTLPERVAREPKSDEKRQETSFDSETTTGLPVT